MVVEERETLVREKEELKMWEADLAAKARL